MPRAPMASESPRHGGKPVSHRPGLWERAVAPACTPASLDDVLRYSAPVFLLVTCFTSAAIAFVSPRLLYAAFPNAIRSIGFTGNAMGLPWLTVDVVVFIFGASAGLAAGVIAAAVNPRCGFRRSMIAAALGALLVLVAHGVVLVRMLGVVS